MVFVGRYYHALEQKGRITVPKEFQPAFVDGGVITLGIDENAILFPEETWQKYITQLQALPYEDQTSRAWMRLQLHQAHQVVLDRLGRIKIPSHIIDSAKLSKNCVCAGTFDRVEIWDRETYHAHFDTITNKRDQIAQEIAQYVHNSPVSSSQGGH